MTRPAAVGGLLVAAVFASAVGKVYVVHLNRTTFTEVQQAQALRDRMNVEWGQLQIEQATWSTHGRIEQLAADELAMRVPDPDAVVIVR